MRLKHIRMIAAMYMSVDLLSKNLAWDLNAQDLKKTHNCQNWGVGACMGIGDCVGQYGIN